MTQYYSLISRWHLKIELNTANCDLCGSDKLWHFPNESIKMHRWWILLMLYGYDNFCTKEIHKFCLLNCHYIPMSSWFREWNEYIISEVLLFEIYKLFSDLVRRLWISNQPLLAIFSSCNGNTWNLQLFYDSFIGMEWPHTA